MPNATPPPPVRSSRRRRARRSRQTPADVVVAVHRLGGTCTWRELRRAVSWRLISRAVREGLVRHPGNGVYSLPDADDARVVARRMTGVVSHRTAALHWGWKVKTTPDLPDVTIPSNRKLRPSTTGLSTPHRRTFSATEVSGGWVTTPVRTVVDCCLDLPYDEALSVFDSALRGGLPRRAVVAAARALGPRHRARVLALEREATALAANPFESTLRAIARSIPGTGWIPQYRIRYDDLYARVDLADDALDIVLEADSFEFHGQRAALTRDCERYDELVARGWLVLRFTWEQVMLRPDWVADVVGRTVQQRTAERLRMGRMTELQTRDAAA